MSRCSVVSQFTSMDILQAGGVLIVVKDTAVESVKQ